MGLARRAGGLRGAAPPGRAGGLDVQSRGFGLAPLSGSRVIGRWRGRAGYLAAYVHLGGRCVCAVGGAHGPSGEGDDASLRFDATPGRQPDLRRRFRDSTRRSPVDEQTLKRYEGKRRSGASPDLRRGFGHASERGLAARASLPLANAQGLARSTGDVASNRREASSEVRAGGPSVASLANAQGLARSTATVASNRRERRRSPGWQPERRFPSLTAQGLARSTGDRRVAGKRRRRSGLAADRRVESQGSVVGGRLAARPSRRSAGSVVGVGLVADVASKRRVVPSPDGPRAGRRDQMPDNEAEAGAAASARQQNWPVPAGHALTGARRGHTTSGRRPSPPSSSLPEAPQGRGSPYPAVSTGRVGRAVSMGRVDGPGVDGPYPLVRVSIGPISGGPVSMTPLSTAPCGDACVHRPVSSPGSAVPASMTPLSTAPVSMVRVGVPYR